MALSNDDILNAIADMSVIAFKISSFDNAMIF